MFLLLFFLMDKPRRLRIYLLFATLRSVPQTYHFKIQMFFCSHFIDCYCLFYKDCIDIGMSWKIGYHQLSIPALSSNSVDHPSPCMDTINTKITIHTVFGSWPPLDAVYDGYKTPEKQSTVIKICRL